MAAVLALAAAVLYGSADFLGGAGSRRASALSFLAGRAGDPAEFTDPDGNLRTGRVVFLIEPEHARTQAYG